MSAALAVPIVDCYLLVKPDAGTPGERVANLKALHKAMRKELQEREYRWAQADIPTVIEKSVGKRLRPTSYFSKRANSIADRTLLIDV